MPGVALNEDRAPENPALRCFNPFLTDAPRVGPQEERQAREVFALRSQQAHARDKCFSPKTDIRRRDHLELSTLIVRRVGFYRACGIAP